MAMAFEDIAVSGATNNLSMEVAMWGLPYAIFSNPSLKGQFNFQ